MMSPRLKNIFSGENILVIVFLASVFVLAFNKTEDPDAWLHLTQGRLIADLKGMPALETQLYAAPGHPYLYTSWLLGLLYYYAHHFFGFSGVVLLKAVIVTLVFFVLFRDSLRFHNNYAVSAIVLSLIVLLMRHRFTERPDTFAFLYISFSIYALNAFIYENKKYLYLLPLVALLWVNSHSSVNLLFVLIAAFLMGGMLQRYFYGNHLLLLTPPSPVQLKTTLVVFAASCLATLLSPYYLDQFMYGARVLASDWSRQNVVEFLAPTWAVDKEFYIMVALVFFSFALNWRRFSASHFLLLAATAVITLIVRRFMYFFFIVSGPVLVRNIAPFVTPAFLRDKPVVKKVILAGAVLSIMLSSGLTLAKVEPFGNLEKEFGAGVNAVFVPEGALRFMDEQSINGRVFNTFHWGQYITWRDFPKKSAFSDGRFHAPQELLWKMTKAPGNPALLDELWATYGFESILIDYDYEVTSAAMPAGDGPFDAAMAHP